MEKCVPLLQGVWPEFRPKMLEAVLGYIQEGWKVLARSNDDLRGIANDRLIPSSPVVYVSRSENFGDIKKSLKLSLASSPVELRQLPKDGNVTQHGLLYLPHSYVVPGGRFNEMFGWDSYFIVRGLLLAGEIEMAQNMVDNHLYQIANYGKVLNANRTYYLTRSQPPFLSRMVLELFEYTRDVKWLKSAFILLEEYLQFWNKTPHLVESTGLSRYFDEGSGPAPEVMAGEVQHYDRVRELLQSLGTYGEYVGADGKLTELFYQADRSMRESGFDPSHRFGPANAECLNINPVCLNSLLYRMEEDLSLIADLCALQSKMSDYIDRAQKRKRSMNTYLWDSSYGLYRDFNVKLGSWSKYRFLTEAYPLWAGIPDKRQVNRIDTNLAVFEQAGGLVTSLSQTGCQWDYPFGWAPLQMIAVEGLRSYGLNEKADRIAAKFVATVIKEFDRTSQIFEKYDVSRTTSVVDLKLGYTSNEVGFGWTNAAVLSLLHGMGRQ